MAKRASLDDKLDALMRLRKSGALDDAGIDSIRAALRERTPLVIAKAAEVARDLGARQATPDLITAFDRLMEKPEADKGCQALTAVVEAMQKLGAAEDRVYLRGIRHVQMEGNWGGSTDAATGLRCQSAFGLVQMGYRDVVWELARLLADPDQQCRIAAVRGLGHSGATAALPLLQYKVLTAIRDVDVAAECFAAMVEIDAQRGFSFAAEYLDAPDEAMAEAATLAVGESRRPAALDLLKQRLVACFDEETRRTLLLAVGLIRSEPAMNYLVDTVEQSPLKAAASAIAALALYKKDATLRDRVAAVVQKRNDPTLSAALAREFR